MASGRVPASGEFLLRWMGKEDGWELHEQTIHALDRGIDMDDDPLEAVYTYLKTFENNFTIDDVIQVIFFGKWCWEQYSTQDGDDGDAVFELDQVQHRKFSDDELEAFYTELEIYEESCELD